MRGVRFTLAEVRAIRMALTKFCELLSTSDRDEKLAAQIMAKIDAACDPKPVTGLSVKAAVDAMELVLGKGAMAIPPHAGAEWFAKASNRIRANGLTKDDFTDLARALDRKGWSPPYSFERTLWAADRLIAEGKSGARVDFRNAPLDLDEP